MTDLVTIVCPHCSFSKSMAAHAIPPRAGQATCPKCGQRFSLDGESIRREPAPGASMAPPASASAAAPAHDIVASPPRPPAPPQPTPRPARRTLGFAFDGTARDYFGIWIVNTLLKIVTVGIYSAWAKVRRRRFFYGSTSLDNERFEYLADPFTLFKGWLIAAAAFILYSIGTRVSPLLSGITALVVFAAFPWLVVRSRVFNAVNSSYRNIRFGFRPDYRQAYAVYAGLPILSILSLGLLAPYMLYRQKKFVVENSSFGSTSFTFDATPKDFYLLSLRVALAFAAAFGGIGLILWLAGGLNPAQLAVGGRRALAGLALLPALLLPVIYFILLVYGQTLLANLSWNSTCLGRDRFRSTLRTRDLALLFVSNGLAILCSLGLLVPWATIRLARYRFERLELDTACGLDGVVAAACNGQGVGAAGEEVGDLFDMPIEIAL